MNYNNKPKLKSGSFRATISSHGMIPVGHPYSNKAVSTASKPTGLANLGNTCYINATIQALLSLPTLVKDAHHLISVLDKNEKKPYIRLVTPFLDVIRASEMCNFASATKNVHFIKKDLEGISKKFVGTHMQDASEFLTKLLESMNDKIKEKFHLNPGLFDGCPNLIEKNFSSERLEIFQCEKCKFVDSNEHSDQKFFCTLPVSSGAEPPVPLEELVSSIFETEEMRERRCEKCGHTKALTTNRLTKLPRIFVITIKVFDQKKGEMTTKVVRPVSLPDKLDLEKYVADHIELPNSQVAERLRPQTVDEEEQQFQAALMLSLNTDLTSSSANYRLSSVVRHKGETTNSGHYIADVYRDAWFRFNDADVSQVNNYEVMNGDNAYIVMYVRESDMDSALSLDSKQERQVSPRGKNFQGPPSELGNLAKRVKRDLFKTAPADNPREVMTLKSSLSNREIKLFKKSKPGFSPEYPIILNVTSVENFKQEIGEYLVVDPLTIDVIGICLKNGQKYVVTDMSQVVITSAFVCIKIRREKKYLILTEQ